MKGPVEFRGVPEPPDRTPLLIGCGTGVVPPIMLGVATVSGHLGDEAPTDLAGWLVLIALALGMGLGFVAVGALVSFLFRRLQVGLAASHSIRAGPEGLEIRYRGGTWRARWGEIGVEYRVNDDDLKFLVFCGPGGRMEYPDLLGEVDTADLFAILHAKVPPFSVEPPCYVAEVGGRLYRLGRETDPDHVREACRQILQDAEALHPRRFGLLPILGACADALGRVGLPERARELQDRRDRLRHELF